VVFRREKGKPFRKFERKSWVSRVKCAESVREKRKPLVEVVRDKRWERWTTTKRGISVFVGLGENAKA